MFIPDGTGSLCELFHHAWVQKRTAGMSKNWKPNKEQAHMYYLNFITKPGNREKKNKDRREDYELRKSLGLCVQSGCTNDAPLGRVCCEVHSAGRKKKTTA
jgi:hypothetical protein